MSHAPNHATAKRLLLAAIVAAATFLPAAIACADPIADAQAQAAKVQAQVDALNTKAEVASEQYNHAADKYATLSAQATQSARALKRVTAEKNRLQSSLDDRAASIYRQGPLGFLAVLVNARSFGDVDAAYQMMTNSSRKTALNVDQLKDAKARATNTHDRLLAQQSAAKAQKQAMATNAKTVKAQLSAQRTLLAQTTSTVRRLIAEKKAREEAAARAAALAEQRRIAAARAVAARLAAARDSGSREGDSSDSGGSVPAGPIGERAVAYAMKKLGCPYVWAASGPNSFDCSGLTMWAYGKVGVSLPHYSGDQYNHGTHVSRSQLAPGDLVFFGSTIHHVGMYIGNGKFIEAPYTGADVRITKLSSRSDYHGACRPYR